MNRFLPSTDATIESVAEALKPFGISAVIRFDHLRLEFQWKAGPMGMSLSRELELRLPEPGCEASFDLSAFDRLALLPFVGTQDVVAAIVSTFARNGVAFGGGAVASEVESKDTGKLIAQLERLGFAKGDDGHYTLNLPYGLFIEVCRTDEYAEAGADETPCDHAIAVFTLYSDTGFDVRCFAKQYYPTGEKLAEHLEGLRG